jgi:hypothetical protein
MSVCGFERTLSERRLDRITKATLWVAFLVLGSYFVSAFLNYAMTLANFATG